MTDAEADELEIEGEPSVEDLAALYAMVTPSAHDDMKPDAKRAEARAAGSRGRRSPRSSATPAPAGANIWKRIVARRRRASSPIVAIGFGANAVVNGSPSAGTPARQPGRRRPPAAPPPSTRPRSPT